MGGGEQCALRLLYHKGAVVHSNSFNDDWGTSGLDADDCGAFFPLCPALEVLFFPVHGSYSLL